MKPEDWKCERMTEDDLREFVLGLCDGHVFVALTEAELRHAFPILSLGGLAGIPVEEAKKIGVVWEWIDKAGPLAVNGHPMFFSARCMHKEDWLRARDAAVREMKRREGIEI